MATEKQYAGYVRRISGKIVEIAQSEDGDTEAVLEKVQLALWHHAKNTKYYTAMEPLSEDAQDIVKNLPMAYYNVVTAVLNMAKTTKVHPDECMQDIETKVTE